MSAPLEVTAVLPVATTDGAGFSGTGSAHTGTRGLQVPGGSLTRAQHAARAAEIAGLDGVHVPFDLDGDDSWVVAAGALRANRHLLVAAEIHPATTTPVYAAKLSVSLQRFSHGRLEWSVVVETDDATADAVGDRVGAAERADRADEFLTIARAVWTGTDVTVEGRWSDVLGGGFGRPLDGHPFPGVVVRGTSTGAVAVAARHARRHVVDLTDVPRDGHRDVLRDVATARKPFLAGRTDPAPVRTAIRVPVVARASRAEAERDADRAGSPVGTLVGSYADVADALTGLATDGVARVELVLAPAVAETYRLGERVLPLVHDRSTVDA